MLLVVVAPSSTAPGVDLVRTGRRTGRSLSRPTGSTCDRLLDERSCCRWALPRDAFHDGCHSTRLSRLRWRSISSGRAPSSCTGRSAVSWITPTGSARAGVLAAIEPLRRDLGFTHHLRVRNTGYGPSLAEIHLLFPFAVTLETAWGHRAGEAYCGGPRRGSRGRDALQFASRPRRRPSAIPLRNGDTFRFPRRERRLPQKVPGTFFSFVSGRTEPTGRRLTEAPVAQAPVGKLLHLKIYLRSECLAGRAGMA